MNEYISSCICNMTQNLYRSTKIRGNKCENLATIHRWKSYGAMTMCEITRNCRFHKKAWSIGTGGRLTRTSIFTGFTVIVTLSKLSD